MIGKDVRPWPLPWPGLKD